MIFGLDQSTQNHFDKPEFKIFPDIKRMSCEPGFGPITRLVNQASGPSQRPELRPVTECVPTQGQGGFEQQFFQQPRVPRELQSHNHHMLWNHYP